MIVQFFFFMRVYVEVSDNLLRPNKFPHCVKTDDLKGCFEILSIPTIYFQA